MSGKRITLRLWLHRPERDAWLVSLSGIGAGVWLPKSEIVVPEDAIGGRFSLGSGTGQRPYGPVEVDLPEWLAEAKGLRSAPGASEPGLF